MLRAWNANQGLTHVRWARMTTAYRPAVRHAMPHIPACAEPPAERCTGWLMPALHAAVEIGGVPSGKMCRTGSLTGRCQFDPLDV